MSDFEDNEVDTCSFYTFTREDVDAVNLVNWLGTFKSLCPKTAVLQVPPEVLKYLKSDGMVMPQNTHTTAHLNLGANGGGGNDDDDNLSWASISDTEVAPPIPSEFLQKISRGQNAKRGEGNGRQVGEEEFYGEESDEDDILERKSNSSSSSEEDNGRKKSMEVEKFHEFDSLLDTSIKELGGAVMPKVNRKSPKDATWIGFNRSLKCYSPGDIYLLLKTSDLVCQVLEDPYKDCLDDEDVGGASARRPTSATTTSPYFIILKEWNDSWGPEMEFRCFVCANQLIAVSQRDLDTCHSSIVKRKDKLLLNIQNFFLKNIQDKFPVDYYVMDIVCHPNGEIYVVDFDVFGLVTDSLLFTYRELERICCENLICDQTRSTNDDNKLTELRTAAQNSSSPHTVQPCLRFLTESRNFRARKTMGHPALANDVMTYMRECVKK